MDKVDFCLFRDIFNVRLVYFTKILYNCLKEVIKMTNFNIRQPVVFTAENLRYYPFHLSDDLRIIYLVKGSIEIKNIGGNILLAPGDIEFININEPAELISLTNDSLVITLTVSGSCLKEIDPHLLSVTFNVKAIHHMPYEYRHNSLDNIKNTQRLKEIFLDLFKDYTRLGKVFSNDLNVFIKFISKNFDDIIKHFDCDHNSDEHIIQRFSRLENYLQQNLSKKITLSNFAATEYISPQFLSAEFRNKFGITFSGYLEYYRIQKAVALLIKGNVKQSEVISQCGFSSSKYYYRAFKKYMLCTPTEFRKRLHQNDTVFTKYIDPSDALSAISGNNIPDEAVDTFLSSWKARLNLSTAEKGQCLGEPILTGNMVLRHCVLSGESPLRLEVFACENWCFHDGSSIIISSDAQDKQMLFGTDRGCNPSAFLQPGKYTISFYGSDSGSVLFSRIIGL